MLGSLEPVFGFGVNALVRDHVIVTDQGQRAVVCVGNRLALVSALPHDGHSQRADAPPEPMVFLPNAKHVKQVNINRDGESFIQTDNTETLKPTRTTVTLLIILPY